LNSNEWLLIIFIYSGSGIATINKDFTSEDECRRVGEQLAKELFVSVGSGYETRVFEHAKFSCHNLTTIKEIK